MHLHSYSSLINDIEPIHVSDYGNFIANGVIGDYLTLENISTFYSNTAGKLNQMV